MVGQVDCLEVRPDIRHWKWSKLDLSPILYKEPASAETGLYKLQDQDHGLQGVLDWQLLQKAGPALQRGEKVSASFACTNTDRTIGTLLSHELSKQFGPKGLPDDTLHFKLTGTAGQSFGAFATRGVTLELEGDANDYFGKGLSGAQLIVYPSRKAGFLPEENIIIGNVAFYGATSGTAFIRGKGGERFAVRNSGVRAVVEGVGDHGCEYMTGGRIVILGAVGRNFAAGMSGGIAYVYDVQKTFASLCNKEMVDLDPVLEEDTELLDLITGHYRHTGSSVARFILDDFDNQLKHFIKVFPKDYKKALQGQPLKAAVGNR
jgi:glutamate synthase (NADPH) large chain